MAIRETLTLDLSQALSQLDDLERQLDGLIQPIVIPVDVETDQALDQLKRDIRAVDADDIDIDVDVDGVSRAEDEFQDLRRELGRTERALDDVEDEAEQTSRAMLRVGTRGVSAFSNLRGSLFAVATAFAAFQGLRGLTSFFGDAIDSASDLEESTSKAQVVFGEFFDDIQEFSTTAPQALGLANAVALEFTGTFGNLFVALGLSQQAAADLAPEIVQLGADLASFNNIEVTEALDKLRAGLVGEAEPLRVLGVNLTAAGVASKAAEAGLLGVNGELTEAAKVQARYLLILEQTTTAQGDFARTSDGLANTQRTLAGEFENFRAAVGEALVPAFEAILGLGPPLINAIEEGLVPALESFAAAVASVDTDAIALFLAQAPSTFVATTSSASSLAQGLGNIAQALGAVARFDRADFLAQSTQGIEDFNNIIASQTARQAIQRLIVTLSTGVEPGAAFADTLDELGKSVSGLSLEQFQGLLDQLLAISDLSDVEISGLIRDIRATGIAAGFSEAGVNLLVQSLLDARDVSPRLRNELDEVARVLKITGAAGAEAAPDIALFGEALAGTADDLRRGEVNAAIAELEAQFDSLPGVIGAAADAIKTEGDEVIESLTEFIIDFRDALEALETFEANLAILRALGLENVADIFEGLGPENAAQLAADAVLNPAEAQEMADIIAGTVSTVGPQITGAIADSISSEPVTDALIDRIIQAAADANTPAVRQALLDLANALTLAIPVTVGITVGEAIVDFRNDPEAEAAGEAFRDRPDGFTIIFNGADVPTADSERAVQTIRSLVR